MNEPKKLFVWSGGNQFKVNTNNPDLQTAAMQREAIRRDIAQADKERTDKEKFKEMMMKYFS